eukprot:scaffold7736_cov46-Attheya_sp.AAC.3
MSLQRTYSSRSREESVRARRAIVAPLRAKRSSILMLRTSFWGHSEIHHTPRYEQCSLGPTCNGLLKKIDNGRGGRPVHQARLLQLLMRLCDVLFENETTNTVDIKSLATN